MFSRLVIYKHLDKIFIYSFLLLFLCQFSFWFKTENIKPNLHIVPQPPSKTSVRMFSLGDEQLYFRILALKIENAGDSFGRFSSFRDYNYEKLYRWFKVLDSLDNRSSYIPTLAANYFSQTQNKEDTRYLVTYLDEFASHNIDKYWWWIVQAFHIANSTLKDYPLALNLAYKLSANQNESAPIWTKQLPPIVHAKLGEDCDAFAFINKILQENESGKYKISEEEMIFMRHFIKNNLDKLKAKKFDPKKCKYQKNI